MLTDPETMKHAEAQAEFERRSAEIRKNCREIRNQYHRAHSALYWSISELFFFWLEYDKIHDFWASEFKKRRIRHEKLADGQKNFNALAKWAFGFEEGRSPSSDMNAWGVHKALQFLGGEVDKKGEAWFAHNGIGKGVALIEAEGGIAGIIKKSRNQSSESEPTHADDPNDQEPNEPADTVNVPGPETDPVRPQGEETVPTSPPPPPRKPKLEDVFLTELTKQGVASATAKLRGCFSATWDGYTVLFGRKLGTNFLCYGSSDDPDLIKQVGARTISADLTVLCPRARILVETIQPLRYPGLPSDYQLAKDWLADKHYSGDVPGYTEQRSARILHIDPDWAVLTRATGQACVIVRCDVKTSILKRGSYYLDQADVLDLELVGNASTKRLEVPNDDNPELFLVDVVSRDRHGLTLKPSLGYCHFNHHAFEPTCRVVFDQEFARRLRDEFSDRWFKARGKHDYALKTENATLRLRITQVEMKLEWNLEDSKTGSKTIKFLQPAEELQGYYDALFFSRDLAPVLHNLAGLRTTGPIIMLANEHALVFRYTTVSGAFEIAVPTVSVERRDRRSELFHFVGGPDAGKSR